MAGGQGIGSGHGYGVGSGLSCFLVVVNIFFGLFGFVLHAAGNFIRDGERYYLLFVQSAADAVPKMIAAVGLSGAESKGGQTVDFQLILGTLSIGLICVGFFLFLMAILGCIGACCKVKVIMIIYVIVLIIMFIAQLVMVCLYATGGLETFLTNTFTDIIKNDYGGIDDYGAKALLLNVCMIQFKCCGASGFKDFAQASKWVNQRDVTGQTGKVTFMTPVACCKFTGTLPAIKISDQQCMVTARDANNNMNTGCVDAMLKEMDSVNTIIIGVLAGILAFQAILIIIVIVLLVLKSKDENKVV